MFLFSQTKGVPRMASSRIQRWALTLSAYRYTIRYKAEKDLSHADALSRLPRPATLSMDTTLGAMLLLVDHLESTSISAPHIKVWTMEVPTLPCVSRFIETGWPEGG